MTARVLVVDDVLPNVKLLEAKLTSEYFEVATAYDGPEALEAVKRENPDIILLDVMMPGMDGFEVCRRLKADPEVAHIPVVMVTALSEPSDRVRGLEVGADDFLTKPVNDIALFARVRSLVRLKIMMDELRVRDQTGNEFGIVEATEEATLEVGSDARILLVEDSPQDVAHMQSTLATRFQVTVESDCQAALALSREGHFDLVIVTLDHAGYDSLRFCSQVRTTEETRQIPILVVVDDGDVERLGRALDLGTNDYLMRPIDRNELLARAFTQIRRKRYQDRLRQNYQLSLTMAVTDSLTGLYNRRYMETHLANLLVQAELSGKPVSVMMLDIDFFKSINDSHGHGVGDEVLREFAERVQRHVRGVDLASRVGGEEFLVMMPDTDRAVAQSIADRLRKALADEPFAVAAEGVGPLSVSCSIGVATTLGGESSKSLVRRADEALYQAKRDGRNRVVSAYDLTPNFNATKKTVAIV